MMQVSEESKKMENAIKDHTPKEIIPEVRFTIKEDNLYAFICSYDKMNVTIKSLGLANHKKISELTPLGVDIKVKWKQTEEGLKIEMPEYPIAKVPVIGFKITL